MKIKRIETNFTQVSNNILKDNRLTWKAKGVFAYLYSKPDDWDFSTERMKFDSFDGREALLSGLKELETLGYLQRKRFASGKMEYVLDYNPKSENPIEAKKPLSGNPTVGKSHSGKTRRISNTELNTSNTERENNTEGVYSDKNFVEVWEIYPRKTGKGGAWKVWQKLKITQTLAKKIIESVKSYSKTKQWQKDDGQFVPHLVTFLNQRRFDDEVKAEKLDTGSSADKYKGL